MEGGQQQIDDVEKKMPDAVGERERGSVSSYDDTFSEKSTVARGTPFPSSIYRILFSELCERFAYYGLVGAFCVVWGHGVVTSHGRLVVVFLEGTLTHKTRENPWKY